MGILVATSAVIASNLYVMMNTYRWDWFTCLINAISNLLIFTWTGIYSSFTASSTFYNSAAQVYGAFSFWVVLLLTVMIALLPRFAYNSFQKVFFPLDVDIIREQVTLGKFKYLDERDNLDELAEVLVKKAQEAKVPASSESATSSELAKPVQPAMKQDPSIPDDDRPFYPPSMAPTRHNARSQNGSNGTNYTGSLDQNPRPQSVDYVRRSHERTRHSFEQSNDFNNMNQQTSYQHPHYQQAQYSQAQYQQTHVNHHTQNPFQTPDEQNFGHNMI